MSSEFVNTLKDTWLSCPNIEFYRYLNSNQCHMAFSTSLLPIWTNKIWNFQGKPICAEKIIAFFSPPG